MYNNCVCKHIYFLRKGGTAILNLFRKESARESNSNLPALPKAAAFVDYEHWYISLKNNYGIQPNIKGWFEELNKHFNLLEVNFFADFSHKSLADEIGRIRLFSNKIIDTRSPNGVKKDFTDFIILDNMYQKALASEDIDVFILFSGDGHFSSVTSFLKNFYHKQVIVYGINGSFSKQLKETATAAYTLPTDQEINGSFYRHIFDYLKTSKNPTYPGAISEVMKKVPRGTPKNKIVSAVKSLMEEDIISEIAVNRSSGKSKAKKQKSLFVDWEKAEKSGLYHTNL